MRILLFVVLVFCLSNKSFSQSLNNTDVIVSYDGYASVYITSISSPYSKIMWEKKYDGGSWIQINSNNSSYGEHNITVPFYVRARIFYSDGSDNYTNNTCLVHFGPLNPGSISLQSSLPYSFDDAPSITSVAASGGSNVLQYEWQVSENGIVSTIGYNESFPTTFKLKDNVSIWRKATSGAEVALSNTLQINLTTTDYENLNYVRENTIVIPGITYYFEADKLTTGKKFTSTNYLDGLGRTVQSVSKETSLQPNNTWGDNVAVHTFDEYGREDKTYLPYSSTSTVGKFKTDPITSQIAFIHTKFSDVGNTYAKTVFEHNALSRVTKSLLPGNAWGNSDIGTSFDYDFNTASENIKIWEVDYGETDLPATTGNYGAGKLLKTTTVDENGKKTIEYKDLSGNLILSKVQEATTLPSAPTSIYDGWVCTYYVYDDFGKLRFTITPKAVESLVSNPGVGANINWSITTNLASELCFSNYYDDQGRIIVKHSPGAGNQEMVYDQRDRLVYNRDETDKVKKRWLVNLPDGYNRPQVSGFLFKTNTSATDYTRTDLQTIATGVTIAPVTISSTTTGNTGSLPSIVTSVRETWRNEYLASQEIVFNPGFESVPNDAFTAEIVNTPPVQQTQQMVSSGNFIPTDATLVTLSVNYYDDYNYSGAKAFSSNYSFPSSTNTNILATTKAARTFGSITGQKVRVIDDEDYTNDNFLLTSIYYNEHGNLLQQVSDNYLQSTRQVTGLPATYNDVLTNQYDFAGKLLSSCFKETLPGTIIQNFPVTTSYEYDNIGRVISLSKSYNSQTGKKLVSYSYNEMGQMISKKLSPDYNSGNGLETLKYDFNIQGWLSGINKGYANNDQWSNYFGMELGYENGNSHFASPQYNGSITGTIWKSQGDNKPRKYDYTYTPTGYLNNASSVQKDNPSGSFATSKYDFSVPQLSYDKNGNLTSLQQKGLIPGKSASDDIDVLTYTYDNTNGPSNRLIGVTDAATTATANGTLGDFTNGTNLPTQQYVYNTAGNLVKDYNKNIQSNGNDGVEYNILNKPYKVNIQGKYLMQYIYDASGNKLARKVTNTSVSPNTTKWQYYINDVVLEDGEVQFFINETGRLRVSKDASFAYTPAPTLTITGNLSMPINNKPAFFDFYITDHLDNTRMILTEEVHKETHKATMEVADAREKAYEEGMFGQVDANGNPTASNELIASRAPVNVPAWTSHYNAQNLQYASKLNAATQKIGPNAFFRVMAGDKLTLSTEYYYASSGSNGGSGIVSNVVSSLISALTGSSAVGSGIKSAGGTVQGNLTGNGIFSGIIQNPANDLATNPNAHLNYLFFDENFDPITASSSAKQVGDAGELNGATRKIDPFDVTVPANGYAFVYVSNNSNTDVWFDNVEVSHERGRILQENHYYPYGLPIASISSKAAGKMDNMYRYQGAYSEFEEETGWNDFELRTYDAQIGRWTGVDPYDQFPSQYTGMGNNPINTIDPSGGIGIDFGTLGNITGSILGDRLLAAGAGAAIGYGIDKLTGGKGGWGAAIGAGVGFGATFIPPFDIGSIGNALGKAAPSIGQGANIAANAYIQYAGSGGYQPLYKDFFLNYVRTTMCPNCGTGTLQNTAGLHFQDLFEDYVKDNFTFSGIRVVKDPANNKLAGELRNTVPDYFGIKYSATDGKKAELTSFYELESFFELKATKNNVGVSSFDGQLKVQIQAAKRLQVREIVIITTSGVQLTRPLRNYAAENGIMLTHYWSQYMMLPNNKMKLNYTPAR